GQAVSTTARARPRAKGKGRPGRPRRVRLLDTDENGAEEEVEEPAADDETSAIGVLRRKRRRLDREGRERLRRKRLKRRKRAVVRPSPPLRKTDPLGAYLAGEMVPCPVGCGGFSEIVRIGTLPSRAGEVWFECLSCAQRRMFEVPKATKKEVAEIAAAAEVEGRELLCPRHSRPVILRRRGRDFVCPECGIIFPID
ncbi:MAG: hypothetical protein ACREM1_12670, partial [Longimicrobiales bacterium]